MIALTFRFNRVGLTKNFCVVSPHYCLKRLDVWFYLGSQLDLGYS